MPHLIVRTTDGWIRSWERVALGALFDPAVETHVETTDDRVPDHDAERWDFGARAYRPTTPAERPAPRVSPTDAAAEAVEVALADAIVPQSVKDALAALRSVALAAAPRREDAL